MALLTLFSLSTAALTHQARSILPRLPKVDFTTLYTVQMVVVCAWGFLIFEASEILSSDPRSWLASVPVGLAAGAAAGWCDRSILRRATRRTPARAGRGTTTSRRFVKLQAAEAPGRPEAHPYAARSPLPSRAPSPATVSRWILGGMIVIAVLEELIYRGFLAQSCRMLPGTAARAIGLAGVVGCFALAHLPIGGWPHVLAKLPLSAVAMAGVLLTGTALTGVVAHVLFNVQVWCDLERHGFPHPPATEPGWG